MPHLPSVAHMPRPLAPLTVASLALALLALLGGCVTPAPEATTASPARGVDAGRSSSAAHPAAITSEDAAITAALAAVDEYLAAASDHYTLQSDELAPFVGVISSDLMDAERTSLDRRGPRTAFLTGRLSAFDVAVTQLDLSPDYPTVFVRVRLCLDYRDTRWTDAAGDDITSPDRAPWVPVELALIDDPDDPSRLLVDDYNAWVGYDFCPAPRGYGER